MSKITKEQTGLKGFKRIDESCLSLPETMEALILSGKGMENLSLQKIPVPQPGKDQFLARVDAVFGCASDGKLIDNGKEHALLSGWDLLRWPVSIGHEGCITAVKVGENLKGKIKVGDSFAVQPAINAPPINHRERYSNVASVDKVAVGYSLGGMFAEYILITEEVIQTDSLIPYDTDKISYFAAAFSEPLSCVYSAQNQVPHIYKEGPLTQREARLGLKKGGVTLILGAGPMGIIHADLASIHSPRVIIVSEPRDKRREHAMQILQEKNLVPGSQYVFTKPDELQTVLNEHTRGKGVDDCITALGVAKIQEMSLDYLAKGGVANFFGGTKPGASQITVDTRRIHYDSISMVGSSGGDPSDVHAVMKLLADGDVSPELYVRRVGGLDSAYDLVSSIKAQDFFGKGLIYPHVRHPLFNVDSWASAKEDDFLDKNLLP